VSAPDDIGGNEEWADDAGERVSPFARLHLADIMRRPARRPALLENLLYPAKLHTVTGPPESGKSALCIWLMLTAIGHQHPVIMFDGEAGAEHTADILRAFGGDPDLVDKFLWYVPFPETGFSVPDIAWLRELVREVRPVLSVWDSSAVFMAQAGVNENSTGEVTRFWSRIWLPLAREEKCAVLVTDHDAKGGNGGGDRYARGSSAKLAGVDVAWKLQALTPFSRDQDGRLSLTVVKDRPGCLHRHWEITVTRDPLYLAFRRTSPPSGGGGGLGPAEEKLLAALTFKPMSTRTLMDRFAAMHGHGLRGETVSRCLNHLVELGLTERGQDGREAVWCKPAPEPDENLDQPTLPEPEPGGDS
jgi:hypothetical protein